MKALIFFLLLWTSLSYGQEYNCKNVNFGDTLIVWQVHVSITDSGLVIAKHKVLCFEKSYITAFGSSVSNDIYTHTFKLQSGQNITFEGCTLNQPKTIVK